MRCDRCLKVVSTIYYTANGDEVCVACLTPQEFDAAMQARRREEARR